MKPERTGRVWAEVRRTLGRMVGHVTTHGLPEAHTGITVAVKRSTATDINEPLPGVRRPEWQPSATVFEPPALAAQAGANGIDLAAVATVTGMDRSLSGHAVKVLTVPCLATEPRIHTTLTDENRSVGHSVHEAPMRFAERPTLNPAVIFAPPVVRAVSGTWTISPKDAAGRQAAERWQFRPGRIRDGLPMMLRKPLTRERVPVPYGMSPVAAFTAERVLLAGAAGVPESDVALIGVFPQVPLEAVQRLAVAPGGTALEIWVKPEMAGRTRPLAVVTVILGRQRSTGKTLQTIRREAAAGQGRPSA